MEWKTPLPSAEFLLKMVDVVRLSEASEDEPIYIPIVRNPIFQPTFEGLGICKKPKSSSTVTLTHNVGTFLCTKPVDVTEDSTQEARLAAVENLLRIMASARECRSCASQKLDVLSSSGNCVECELRAVCFGHVECCVCKRKSRETRTVADVRCSCEGQWRHRTCIPDRAGHVHTEPLRGPQDDERKWPSAALLTEIGERLKQIECVRATLTIELPRASYEGTFQLDMVGLEDFVSFQLTNSKAASGKLISLDFRTCDLGSCKATANKISLFVQSLLSLRACAECGVFNRHLVDGALCLKCSAASVTKEFQCCVCMQARNLKLSLLPCGHWFHETCVVQWLVQTMTCPVCKTRHGQPPSWIDEMDTEI